ncbi:MAG: GAF domain-containing protein [Cyclobacteriaceae bacterium]|nr:GAF domain-containing protein [Cyclobacteriaceae bacterium]
MFKFKDSIRLSDSFGIKLSIFLVISLVGINGIYIYGKLNDLKESRQRITDILEFREQIDMIFEAVQKSDLGMRGFYINPDSKMLQPHTESIADQQNSLKILTALFQKYGLETPHLLEFMGKVRVYIELNDLLIEKIRGGDLAYVAEVVKSDPGYQLWLDYSEFIPEVDAFLTELNKTSEQQYQQDVLTMIFVQILILLIGVPALLTILNRIVTSQRKRHALFASIDASNRQFVFDNQEAIDSREEERIIDYLKKNLAEASEFIKEVTNRNYNVSWTGLTDSLAEYNRDNLAGNMIKMRDHMKEVKLKDDQHLWSVNGLAMFSDIIRNNMNDLTLFADRIVSELVKYTEANQAAFFVVNEDQEILELKGCFAYDRKKFINQGIEKGHGLAGQCWQDKQLIVLREIPREYVSITSGLGEATPTYLIVAPLLAEEKVMGVLEIASFGEFEPYKVDFIGSLCASIGSSLAMISANEKTGILLQESKEMAERLRSQEEELLQNTEELQATQEEMQRKLQAAEHKIAVVEKLVGKIELDDKSALVNERAIYDALRGKDD